MAKLILRSEKVKTWNNKENQPGKGETILSPKRQQQKEGNESPVTPGNFENLKQQKLHFAECTKNSEHATSGVKGNRTPVSSKKRRRSNAEV